MQQDVLTDQPLCGHPGRQDYQKRREPVRGQGRSEREFEHYMVATSHTHAHTHAHTHTRAHLARTCLTHALVADCCSRR